MAKPSQVAELWNLQSKGEKDNAETRSTERLAEEQPEKA
jgi:hypothetical protein